MPLAREPDLRAWQMLIVAPDRVITHPLRGGDFAAIFAQWTETILNGGAAGS